MSNRNPVLDPWDLAREEEEQALGIDSLRENMSWDEDGLARFADEDRSEYADRRYARGYDSRF